MADVTVLFKNGERRELKDNGRPGGSYAQTVRYEGAFVIVTDAWGEETAFPASEINEVIKSGDRRAYW